MLCICGCSLTRSEDHRGYRGCHQKDAYRLQKTCSPEGMKNVYPTLVLLSIRTDHEECGYL